MTDPDLSLDLSLYQGKDPDQALEGALASVRSYCGWHLAPSVSATADVWSVDGRSVFLKTLGLTAVTSVIQDGVTISSTNYTFESYGLIRCTPGAYFSTLTRVTVAFTHGYTDLPSDVMDVVLALAQRSINDTRGLVPRAGAGQSMVLVESNGTHLTAADKDKLAPYIVTAGFA